MASADWTFPKIHERTDISFYTPLFLFIGGVGFLVICVMCCKKFNQSGEPEQQQPTGNQHIPPPLTAPLEPTAPPLVQASDLPPYSEVVDKPYFYPVPVGHPPGFVTIAMEDLSRLLSLQDQCSRIISERSSASAGTLRNAEQP